MLSDYKNMFKRDGKVLQTRKVYMRTFAGPRVLASTLTQIFRGRETAVREYDFTVSPSLVEIGDELKAAVRMEQVIKAEGLTCQGRSAFTAPWWRKGCLSVEFSDAQKVIMLHSI